MTKTARKASKYKRQNRNGINLGIKHAPIRSSPFAIPTKLKKNQYIELRYVRALPTTIIWKRH